MSLFLRQLARKGQPIEIQERTLDDDIDSDETEAFLTLLPTTAIVCTPHAKTIFNDVGIEEDVTHEFHMIYDALVTGVQQWILFKDRRFRILNMTNCCEQDKRLVINCTERGSILKGAADA